MYKEFILSKLVDYLKKTDLEFKKSGKVVMLECPFCKKKPISANIIPNTSRINCFACKKRYNLLDIVRELEPNKKDLSEKDLLQYLKEKLEISITTEKDQENLDELLSFYEKAKLDLVPIAANTKIPVEKDWTNENKNHRKKPEWKDWIINGGLNIGVKTGKISNITVLDIDGLLGAEKEEFRYKKIGEERKKELLDKRQKGLDIVYNKIKDIMGEPLIQKNLGGEQLIYQYESDLSKTKIDIEGIHIDIENDGGYVLIPPSKLGITARKFKELKEIPKMPDELKKLLKSKVTIPRKTESEEIRENIETGDFKINPKDFLLKNNNLEGCCNSSFIKLGGILRKNLNIKQTTFVLQLLNQHLLENPMDSRAIDAMIRELDNYIIFDEQELAHEILEHVKEVKEITKSDLELSIAGEWTKGEAKKRFNKTLQYLIKEEKIIQRGKKIEIIEEMEWKDTLIDVGIPVDFKVPYLHDYSYFNWNDLIIIASKMKYGKTHLAVNCIKRLISQGIKPYYLYSESGGRFSKIALTLGIKEGDFYHCFISDANKLILPKKEHSIFIFDWIRPPDFAKTDALFANLVEKVKKVNGFMIAFMQLKKNNDYYAENLISQYPTLVCKYLYENDNDGTYTKFHITENRDSKIKTKIIDIPCIYDWDTKEVKLIDEIQGKK